MKAATKIILLFALTIPTSSWAEQLDRLPEAFRAHKPFALESIAELKQGATRYLEFIGQQDPQGIWSREYKSPAQPTAESVKVGLVRSAISLVLSEAGVASVTDYYALHEKAGDKKPGDGQETRQRLKLRAEAIKKIAYSSRETKSDEPLTDSELAEAKRMYVEALSAKYTLVDDGQKYPIFSIPIMMGSIDALIEALVHKTKIHEEIEREFLISRSTKSLDRHGLTNFRPYGEILKPYRKFLDAVNY